MVRDLKKVTLRWRIPLLSILVSSIALLIVITRPAQAYQVQINPTQPGLGDTISVIIQSESGATAPTVSARGQTYPTYALSGNRYRALVPTSPIDSPGRMALQISGSAGTQEVGITLANRDFPVQRITLSSGRAGLEATDHELARLDALKALRTPQKYWSGPMSRPSDGRVSSVYGIRRYYNGEYAQNYYHRGVDYAQGEGAPLYAPAAGRVVVVGRVRDGFALNGNTLGIDHGQGVVSIMIHLSGFNVNEGDMVQAGQRVASMGSTGFATGPNLHWGLYVNDVSVDPVPWRYDGFE
jgi:murein DD-endopeptidase MepM/ murein hydrolase activator NlpD